MTKGLKHTDQLKINSCFHHCCSSETPEDISVLDNFCHNLDILRVDLELAAELEKDISVEDVMEAMRITQSGKSPGPDGYPSEFLKTFSESLAPLLLSIFKELFSSNSLPPTMREATISLILKKDKNPLKCSSYHPISLLNTDVKLLAKLLAQRLKAPLPSIISTDQTDFMKNCYSFFNVRHLLNILYSPSPSNTPKILLSLDAEKVFDRVEWDYLFYILEKFVFRPKFISWIKILFFSPLAAIHTNNNLSTYFKLQRGTRQGCPMSPLLFAIAIEPLALAMLIRQDVNIKIITRGCQKCSFPICGRLAAVLIRPSV